MEAQRPKVRIVGDPPVASRGTALPRERVHKAAKGVGAYLERMRSIKFVAACALLLGCANRAAAPAAPSLSSAMPEGAPREPLAWADLTPATLARAKAE